MPTLNSKIGGNRLLSTLVLASAVLFSLLSLSGCESKSATELTPATQVKSATMQLYLYAYNHMDRDVESFKVEVVGGESMDGDWVRGGTGGNDKACCVKIPRNWRSDIKAIVRSQQKMAGELQTVENSVVLPKWQEEKPNRFNLHFLRDGSVKVFVSASALGNDSYPFSGKEAELIAPKVPLDDGSRMLGVLVGHLRQVIPDETDQVPKEELIRFVDKYQRRAIAAGVYDIDRQTQYLLLALYTSGAGVEHPECKKLMANPPNDLQAFHDAMQRMPQAVWDSGLPLWQTYPGANRQ